MKPQRIYHIERLTDERINDLVGLYENAFGKPTSEAEIAQKFDTSFTGYKNLGFIAYSDQGEPAAFYGVLPCYAIVDGERVLVAQSGHTMTHTNHRRAKLFVRLAEHTFEFCKQEGFKAVFGFPNVYSYAGFIKKLSWNHFDDYHAFVPRVSGFPWIRVKKLFPMLHGVHTKRQQSVLKGLKSVEHFDNSLPLLHPIIEHDHAFFEYKKFQNSYVKEFEGIRVWFKLTEMFLMVGDVRSDYDFEVVHSKLSKLAKKLGVPHIRYQVCSGTPVYEACLKAGLTKGNTYPIAGIALESKFPLEKMKFTLADFDTF